MKETKKSLQILIIIVFVFVFITAFLNTDNGCDLCIFPPEIVGPLLLVIGPMAGISAGMLIVRKTSSPEGAVIAFIGGSIIGVIGLVVGLLLTFLVGLT